MIELGALVFGPAGRRVPWLSIGTTFLVCVTVALARALQVESASDLLQVARLTSVLMAAAAASCLEDGNEMVTAATPFGRLRRRLVAVLLTGLVTVGGWLIVMIGAAAGVRAPSGGPSLPVGGLLIELLALMAFGWLVAAILMNRSSWHGSGMRAGLGVIIAALITISVARLARWLWPMPGRGWVEGHQRWTAIAIVSIVVFMLTSRDPAARLPTQEG
jgi:hypothetical protein